MSAKEVRSHLEAKQHFTFYSFFNAHITIVAMLTIGITVVCAEYASPMTLFILSKNVRENTPSVDKQMPHIKSSEVHSDHFTKHYFVYKGHANKIGILKR